MNSASIYETILMGETLNKLKHRRDQWNRDQWYPSESARESMTPKLLNDIGGNDSIHYEFLMSGSKEILFEDIVRVIVELARIYELDMKPVNLTRENAYLYGPEGGRTKVPSMQSGIRKSFVYRVQKDSISYIYAFKEFGIGEYLPESMRTPMSQQLNAIEFRHVSFVESKAYSDILNHATDANDPTRGTGSYTLEQFFDTYFSKEEYRSFIKALNELKRQVREYYGLTIVKMLSANAMHNFRRDVRDKLMSQDYTSLLPEGSITSEQRAILDSHYLNEGAFEGLVGTKDYAQSFSTAEWMYNSLRGKSEQSSSSHSTIPDTAMIDLTPILLGYIKAIEQFLFDFICLHTAERDGVTRIVYVGHDEPLVNRDTALGLKDKLTLGGLTGFFGFRFRNGQLKRKDGNLWNSDLLYPDITSDTYGVIVDTLSSIPELRNGYLHKDNLLSWPEVERTRSHILLSFYLLLGSYMLSDDDRRELDITRSIERNDFYRLCEYIHLSAIDATAKPEGPYQAVPIFYIGNTDELYDFFCACPDDHISGYDKYGDAVYSGAYLRRLPTKSPHYDVALSNDNTPSLIREGRLLFGVDESGSMRIDPTGPEKIVFKDGVFHPISDSN